MLVKQPRNLVLGTEMPQLWFECHDINASVTSPDTPEVADPIRVGEVARSPFEVVRVTRIVSPLMIQSGDAPRQFVSGHSNLGGSHGRSPGAETMVQSIPFAVCRADIKKPRRHRISLAEHITAALPAVCLHILHVRALSE